MKRALVVAFLLVVFVATLLATVPVGPAVRWMFLRSHIDPDVLRFAAARLTWNGVLLEDVEIDLGTGAPLALPWVRVRPSLASLLRFGDGLPATTTTRICDGWLDAQVERGESGHRISGVWTDLDVGRCADALPIPGDVEGSAQGRIDLTVTDTGDRHGSGVLRARSVTWSVPGMPRHVPTRADTAEIQWDLDRDALTIRRLELENDEFVMSAAGTITLARPQVESTLAVDLTITPRPGMPQAHRDLFMSLAGGPPTRDGTRTFRLVGTVGQPVLERP